MVSEQTRSGLRPSPLFSNATPSGLRPSPPPRGGERAHCWRGDAPRCRSRQSRLILPLSEGEMGVAQRGSRWKARGRSHAHRGSEATQAQMPQAHRGPDLPQINCPNVSSNFQMTQAKLLSAKAPLRHWLRLAFPCQTRQMEQERGFALAKSKFPLPNSLEELPIFLKEIPKSVEEIGNSLREIPKSGKGIGISSTDLGISLLRPCLSSMTVAPFFARRYKARA